MHRNVGLDWKPPHTLSDAFSLTLMAHMLLTAFMLLKAAILHETFAAVARDVLPRDVIMHKHSPMMAGLFTISHDVFVTIPNTVHEGKRELCF